MFFSLLLVALCAASAHDDARSTLEDFIDELKCNNFDREAYHAAQIRDNFSCGGFYRCAMRTVVSVNLSTPVGNERCSIANANLTRAFELINTSSGINISSLDLRSVDSIAPRLPIGLDFVSSLQTCEIWTENQFLRHPANSPTEPCCDVPPYESPCVKQFMDLYKKYTGLTTCKPCKRPVPPTCSDGVRNGNETGVDCGGDCFGKDCCLNGYHDRDLGENGVDCDGACSKCGSRNTEICSSDDNCCVREVARFQYQCYQTFSPRCASRCNSGRNACELFFSGWQADNTCRPLTQIGICAINSTSCLSSASYTVETCQAVSRPDDSVVFATCDLGCRVENTCIGPWSNTSSTLENLCFLNGTRNCAAGSECNRSGKCVVTGSRPCDEPCAEVDNQYGGCKGVCTAFPCIPVLNRCNCASTIAPSSAAGVCPKLMSNAPATCNSRANCTCDESNTIVSPHLQCETACVKPNATCTVGTPAADWTLERICKVNGETCSLSSGAGVCNESGKCVPTNEFTRTGGSSTSAGGSVLTLPTNAGQSSASGVSGSNSASEITTSAASDGDSSSNSEAITPAMMNDVDRSSPDSQLPIIIGAVVGALCLLLLIAVVVAIVWKRRRRDDSFEPAVNNEQQVSADSSEYLGDYGTSSFQTTPINPSVGVYGSAPQIGGMYESAPDLLDRTSDEALPGETQMRTQTQPVIYDRAM
jgi:hypothetical protein